MNTRVKDQKRIAAMVAKSARDNLQFEIANYVQRPMSGNSLDGSKETVRAFAGRYFTGKDALRSITGIHRLNGERGAMAWYWQFLVDCRVSAAPSGIDSNLWSQHVKAWAQSEVYRVRREGLPGDHVLNDTTEYRCYRARQSGRMPARGFVKIPGGRQPAQKTSNYSELRRTGCTSPWNEMLEKAIHWLPSERAKGIPKSYAGGNFIDCQLTREDIQAGFKAQSAREHLGRRKPPSARSLFDNVKDIERQNAKLRKEKNSGGVNQLAIPKPMQGAFQAKEADDI